MNIWDIVITFAIAAVLFLAIRAVGKNKKKGSGCSCGCAGCSASCAFRQEDYAKNMQDQAAGKAQDPHDARGVN